MEDIIGKKFGRLTVLEKTDKKPPKDTHYYYRCKCECGNECLVLKNNLKSNNTTSCGCYKKQQTKRTKSLGANEIVISEKYITIKIKCKNKIHDCIIDKEDYPKVKKYRWYLGSHGYATSDTLEKRVKMHRLIIDCHPGLEIDHINGNRIDNRKCNLRNVTHHQNMMNRKGVKGVTWDKARKKWIPHIMFKQKRIYLGGYDDIEEAKEARRQAEIKYFGEFRYKD